MTGCFRHWRLACPSIDPASRLPARHACLFLLGVILGNSALAIAPGDYRCSVDSAVLVDADGGAMPLADAPSAFGLRAVDAPVTGEELRAPIRSLEYYPAEEPGRVRSASIDVRLFLEPATGLRSREGLLYTQGPTVLQFSGEGRFIAYGLAPDRKSQSVVVYSGHCLNTIDTPDTPPR